MLDKNLIFAFAAGAAVGVIGARYYKKHEAELSDKLDALRSRLQGAAGFGTEGADGAESAAAETGAAAAADDKAAAESELTLEELEAQKEHLEDLIAELQAKMQAKAQGGAAAGTDSAAGAGV